MPLVHATTPRGLFGRPDGRGIPGLTHRRALRRSRSSCRQREPYRSHRAEAAEPYRAPARALPRLPRRRTRRRRDGERTMATRRGTVLAEHPGLAEAPRRSAQPRSARSASGSCRVGAPRPPEPRSVAPLLSALLSYRGSRGRPPLAQAVAPVARRVRTGVPRGISATRAAGSLRAATARVRGGGATTPSCSSSPAWDCGRGGRAPWPRRRRLAPRRDRRARQGQPGREDAAPSRRREAVASTSRRPSARRVAGRVPAGDRAVDGAQRRRRHLDRLRRMPSRRSGKGRGTLSPP